MRFVDEIRQTLAPGRNTEHGPLPPLLVAMTFVTGLVDAFSYLLLGRVFVANMTGNVVLLGFALVGAPGFSIGASVVSMASFTGGALIGGRIGAQFAQHRGILLATTASLQAALLAAAVAFALLPSTPIPDGYRYALIAVLAGAMGTQNAAARKLSVPDLTTTVLTLTLTGMAADSTFAGGLGSKAGRRLIAVAAMLSGGSGGRHTRAVRAPGLPTAHRGCDTDRRGGDSRDVGKADALVGSWAHVSSPAKELSSGRCHVIQRHG